MKIKTLNTTSIEVIADVFNQAFADYAIKIQFTAEAKRQRSTKARVNLNYSVGVFDEERIVAFILIGTGQWHGHNTTFNTGTGVIPDYRGQRLVKQMYDFVVPIWKENGFTQTALEVLVDNEIAIKAYESVGMQKKSRLVSYHGTLPKQALPSSMILSKKEAPDWQKYESFQAFDYSWDFCKDGVEAVSDTYQTYELLGDHDEFLAFAIIHQNGQIAQAGVSSDDYWSTLMTALGAHYDNLKWINIQEDQTILINALQSIGWKILVEQFEMRGTL